MGKKMWVILIAIVCLMLYVLVINITGLSVFDAYLSSRGVNLSVVIDMTSPHVEIISPQNITYPSEDVDLDYNVSDKHSSIHTIWYNLDGGSNTTITAPGKIRAPAGNHILYLYVNDTAGNTNFTFINFSTTAPPPEEEEGTSSPGGGGFVEPEEENITEDVEEVEEPVPEEAGEEVGEAEELEEKPPKITPYKNYNEWYLLISIIVILIYIALFLKRRKEKKAKTGKKKKK